MGRQTRKQPWWRSASVWLAAPLLAAGCATTEGTKLGDGFHSLAPQSSSSEPSWTDKLVAPFKSGTVGSNMDNRAATANDSDALSLSKKPDKKNPELIVAIAQMHERAGKLDEAEQQYKKALKYEPKHLGALVGYAHLQDRRHKLDEATKLYQKALAAHPNEAGVHNDLGLCYHRQGKMLEAQAALAKAVDLAPERKLYRNNLATVCVEQGNIDAALAQLTAAHGEAAAHYNLGYLLAKKGRKADALRHFQYAATVDPTLTAAQQWVAKLSPPAAAPAPAVAAETTTPYVAQRAPVYPTTNASVSTTPMQSPPRPGASPTYLQSTPTHGNSQNPWNAPPADVRYPNQQTSAQTGSAALPPTPDSFR